MTSTPASTLEDQSCEYPELAAKNEKYRSENLWRPIVTDGGLSHRPTNFDKKFRAFDKSTGELLCGNDASVAGNATPAT